MGDDYREDDDYCCPLSSTQELLTFLLAVHPWAFGQIGIGIEANCTTRGHGVDVTSLGKIAEGTVLKVVGLPLPHPGVDVIVAEDDLEDGFFRLTYTTDQRLRAEVFKIEVVGQTPRLVISVASCPLTYIAQHTFKVAAGWSATGMTMFLNGTLLASTEMAQSELLGSFTIEKKEPSVIVDFSAESAEAQLRRKGRVAGTHPIPGRVPRTLERDLLDLRREVNQINDLLILMQRGRTDHALGVARAVRKLLIGTKGRMGVLQRCAGRIDAPLMMFTASEPARRLHPEPTIDLRIEMSGELRGDNTNPIDVDVWLDAEGGRLGGKYLTHREIVAAIGNSEAAHGDADIHPVVHMLERVKTGSVSTQMQDMLVYYVRCVGETMACVGTRLLTFPATLQEIKRGA